MHATAYGAAVGPPVGWATGGKLAGNMPMLSVT